MSTASKAPPLQWESCCSRGAFLVVEQGCLIIINRLLFQFLQCHFLQFEVAKTLWLVHV